MQENLLVDLLIICTCEGLVACQAHVSDDAEGPHVRPIIAVTYLYHLWRHVLRTTETKGLIRSMVQKLGETEVTKFYLLALTLDLSLVYHDVL